MMKNAFEQNPPEFRESILAAIPLRAWPNPRIRQMRWCGSAPIRPAWSAEYPWPWMAAGWLESKPLRTRKVIGRAYLLVGDME